MKFVALLAPQDPGAAAEELTRAVTERGAVAGVLPTYIPQMPDFGDDRYDPIYAAAARLDVGAVPARLAEPAQIDPLAKIADRCLAT